jgi:hypothetical protein
VKVLERFSLPKRGQGEANGDALYVGQDYVAVIDGATPKDSRTWDSMPADAFVAGCLARGMARLSARDDCRSAFLALAREVRARCAELGRDVTALPVNQCPQASVVIYSAARHEVWRIGDRPFSVNGDEDRSTKLVDRLLGDLRAMAHAVDEARAEGGEGPMWAPDPRVAIMPFLEQQSWLANRRGEFGYGVFTGRDDCVGFAETYPVEPGSHVVLASDGYPRLFDTLERSEAHLASLLREDPGCYDGLRGTKGIAPGNVSYDDRTYVSLIA